MAYPNLPDLSDSRFPSSGCDVVGIQRGYLDPALSTPFENGMAQTRARFPRVRRTFVVPYRYVTPAKRTALDTFIRTTVLGGSGISLDTSAQPRLWCHTRSTRHSR